MPYCPKCGSQIEAGAQAIQLFDDLLDLLLIRRINHEAGPMSPDTGLEQLQAPGHRVEGVELVDRFLLEPQSLP